MLPTGNAGERRKDRVCSRQHGVAGDTCIVSVQKEEHYTPRNVRDSGNRRKAHALIDIFSSQLSFVGIMTGN